MKKISINFIAGEDDFNLDVTSADSKKEEAPKQKPQVEVHDLTYEDKVPLHGKKKVEIDLDVLEALLASAKNGNRNDGSANEELAKAISRLAEATAEGNDTADRRFLGARPVDAYTIDADDVLPNAIIFFANSVSFAIYDDKKAGFTIKPPYNRSFKFKTIQRVVDKSSARTPVYLSLSAVIVRSKKEAEWLRKHSLNGIKFFEQKDGAKDISLELQDKIVQAWSIVSTFDDHTVMQRCITDGINVDSSDIGVLRRKLSFKIAENMNKDEEKIRRNPVKDYEDVVTNNVQSDLSSMASQFQNQRATVNY